MHIENIISKVIKSIKGLSFTVNSPIHACMWSKWGTGKTFSSMKIAKENEDIFYIKVPDNDIKVGKLYKIIANSLNCGVRFRSDDTLDLIRYHIVSKRLKPVFILDEAQRILKKEHVLNELKDLSEIPELSFQYIFLGDLTIPKCIKMLPHSINERILIKKEILNIEKETIEEITKEIDVDIEEFLKEAELKSWTTLHCNYIASAAKAAKVPLRGKTIKNIAKGIGL